MSYLGRLNSLLTSTTSRYDSLRRNILSSSSEDDTNLTHPSSSHVSRVLRAYYTEKALPFPSWLEPDPRDAARTPQAAPQPYATTRPVGSLRGNSEVGSLRHSSGGGGGLGDIWGDGAGGGEGNGGLRRGPGARRPLTQTQSSLSTPQQAQSQGLTPRPLPSQRVGSYQNQNQNLQSERMGSPVPPGSSGSASGGGAAERLKARLNRGVSARGEGGGGAGGGGGGGEKGSYATQGLSGWQGGQGRRY